LDEDDRDVEDAVPYGKIEKIPADRDVGDAVVKTLALRERVG